MMCLKIIEDSPFFYFNDIYFQSVVTVWWMTGHCDNVTLFEHKFVQGLLGHKH